MSEYVIFNSKVNEVLMVYNAVVCAVISLTLMFFRKGNRRHKLGVSVLAWVLCVTYIVFPVQLLFGDTVILYVPHLVVNTVVCIALLTSKGNLAELLKRI